MLIGKFGLDLEVSNTAPNVVWDALRSVFSGIDRAFYGLLQLVYQLFFNVASSDILAGDTIMKFYSRVQLILGVFMMFQLAMIILKGIVNPDSFTDGKTGFGNLIMRICVALFLLTSLVPINIPSPQNEYESQLNNHGLLFGTLYSLQFRILRNNTLGRLILGSGVDADNYVSADQSYSDSLEKSSRVFATTILKTFYRINLLPADSRPESCANEDDPATKNECRMCQEGIEDVINIYKEVDASPGDIIDMVNETCNIDFNLLNYIPGLNNFSDDRRYVFSYTFFIPSIVAIIFTFILISFTIDIAVRAIKLAILRLIAPIPIISYMDPKGSKDGAFNSWVKVLTSTYLDLFVRLAIVYFVLFLIENIMIKGIVIPEGTNGVMKGFTYVAIFIGLFMFARQAPKFLKSVLGLKDSDFKLFGGMGAVVGLGGAVGSAAANWRASAEENKELHEGQTVRNFGRNLGSAIVGGIAGGAIGMDAAGKKDATIGSVLKAQNARNARRASHSTLPGRIADSTYGVFTGRSLADKTTKIGDANKAAFDSLKSWKESLKGEAMKNGGRFDGFQLADGTMLNGIRYSEVQAAVDAGADQDGNITLNGRKLSASLFGKDVMDSLADRQVVEWKNGSVKAGGDTWATVVTNPTGKLYADYQRTIKAVNDAEVSSNGLTGAQLVETYGELGKAMGVANRTNQNVQTDMKQIKRTANKQQNKNN